MSDASSLKSPTSSSTSLQSTTTSTSASTSQTSSSSSSFSSSTSSSTSTHSSTTSTSTFTTSATSSSSSSSLSQQNLNPSTSTVLIITTDSRNPITDSLPPSPPPPPPSPSPPASAAAVITSTSLSTDTNGKLVTVTQTLPNPTLNPNNASPNNPAFFRNTAAVAGVFILVGLAAASIILWIFFAIRSRRRTQRLDHDTAVSATLAAAGFHRTPLDDDDDPGESSRRSRYGSPDAFLHQRRSSSGLAMSSVPSAARTSAALLDILPFHDDNDPHNFNPYSDYIVPAGSKDAYISSPPTSSFIAGPYRNCSPSNTMGEHITGHAPQHSGGSHEPLLSSYNRNSLPPSPTGLTPPPQLLSDATKSPPILDDKPQQSNAALETSVASSVYSSESTGDHRLDPNLRQRLQDDADSFRDLRDEDDYSRPVLGVRNLPDASSQASVR